MVYTTIPLILQARVKELGDKTALMARDLTISWSEFGRLVDDLALGLISLEVGSRERVAILSENRPEWIISSMAVSSIGAITVPIYTTLTTSDIGFILEDSGATTIILSGEGQLKKVLSIREGLQYLKRILVIDEVSTEGDTSILPLSRVMAMGKELDGRLLEVRKEGIRPDDLAIIIYTSGTTGRPKGVMLTHHNLISNISASLEVIDIREDDIYLSFLPLAHSFEHLVHLAFIYRGATIAYSKGFASVMRDIEVFKPTVMIGVPFFFERIKGKVLEAIEASPAFKRGLFWWAYKRQSSVVSYQLSTKKQPLLAGLTDKLIFKRIRKRICPGIRFFISGGAPLGREVAEFFWAIGIPILEGYGLTETSPVVSVNTFSAVKLGSVGRPIPGVEVRLAKDGEIWVKGPNVMKGYFNMPEATSSVIVDGWFSTGDIGVIDEDGFLTITDRKKDIIVTALGKNVAPQKIEALLKSDEYIREALVFGDKRPHLVALIWPDVDRLKAYAMKRGIPFDDREGLIRSQDIYRFYEDRIRVRLKELPRFEQVHRFAILKELTQEEFTPTMKVRRKVVEERYREVIDGMYKGSH